MAGVPASPAPDTANVIVLIVPVVAVLNEYEYVTLVALTWLFVTVQLRLVSAAACAACAPNASMLPATATTTVNARIDRAIATDPHLPHAGPCITLYKPTSPPALRGRNVISLRFGAANS